MCLFEIELGSHGFFEVTRFDGRLRESVGLFYFLADAVRAYPHALDWGV